ncbi:MAG: hypothetical protein HRS57_03230, partial [Mycoplasmataceae bacterium]|nr:hypothetical protein [Mycoplasmataceae bacterium]
MKEKDKNEKDTKNKENSLDVDSKKSKKSTSEKTKTTTKKNTSSSNLDKISDKDNKKVDVEVKNSKASIEKKDPEIKKEDLDKINKKRDKKQSKFKEKWNSSKKFKYGVSISLASVLALSLGLGLGLGLSGSSVLSKGSIPGQSWEDLTDIPLPEDDPKYQYKEYQSVYDKAILYVYDELSAQGLIKDSSYKMSKAEESADKRVNELKDQYKDDYGKSWEDPWSEYISEQGFETEAEYKNSLLADSLLSYVSSTLSFDWVVVDKDNVSPDPSVSTEFYWEENDASASADDFVINTDSNSDNYLKYTKKDGSYTYDPNNPDPGSSLVMYNQRYCSLAVNDKGTSDPNDDTKICLTPNTQPLFDIYIKEYMPIEASHLLFTIAYGSDATSTDTTEDSESTSVISDSVARMSQDDFTRFYNFLLYVDYNGGSLATDDFDFEYAANKYNSDTAAAESKGSLGLFSLSSTGFQEEFNLGLYSAIFGNGIDSSGTLTSGTPNEIQMKDPSPAGSMETISSANFYDNYINSAITETIYYNGDNTGMSQNTFNDLAENKFDLFTDAGFNHMSTVFMDKLDGATTIDNGSSPKYREMLYSFPSLDIEETYYDTPLQSTASTGKTNESGMKYPVIISRNGMHIVKIDELHVSEYYNDINTTSASTIMLPSDPNYYNATDGIRYLTDPNSSDSNMIYELGYRNLVSDLN